MAFSPSPADTRRPSGSATASTSGTGGLLGSAGTVAGALAAAYGTYDWINQLAHAGDHRTAQQMMDTRYRNTYTTPGGHQYLQYGNVDAEKERDFESANRRAKEFNFGATTLGTGLAAGATIGSLFGSGVPVVGTLIGGGVGALLGGLGAATGIFNNQEDIDYAINNANDATARGNRQFRSDAYTQEVRDQFSSRPRLSGRIGAANGKQPVYGANGKVNKKATARVSNGELIGNFEDGYVSRVPGTPNNKDTKLASLKPSDFVISNKYGLSDYAAATGDYVGALKAQDILMSDKYMMNGRETDLLFQAKNGKLPKFATGTPSWMDYGLATLPHFSSFITNLNQYNKDKYASTNVPYKQFENPMGSAAVNQIMSDMIDARPYINLSNNVYRQSAWNARRTPGVGLGSRMVMLDSLARARQAQNADTLLKIDEANRTQRNTGAQLQYNLSADLLSKQATEWQRWLAQVQQANAAKDYALRYGLKNMNNAIASGAADALKVKQYGDAMDIKNRTLGIYQQSVNQDYLNMLYNIGKLGNSTTSAASSPVSSNFDWTNPQLTKPAETMKYMPAWRRRLLMYDQLPQFKTDLLTYNPFVK